MSASPYEQLQASPEVLNEAASIRIAGFLSGDGQVPEVGDYFLVAQHTVAVLGEALLRQTALGRTYSGTPNIHEEERVAGVFTRYAQLRQEALQIQGKCATDSLVQMNDMTGFPGSATLLSIVPDSPSHLVQ